MLYNRANNNNLRILGNNFVKNNKNKGKLIVNNKKQKITEFINIILINDNRIKIKLLLSKNIPNKSCLCRDCTSLLKFSFFLEEKKIPEGNKIIYDTSKGEEENYLDLYPEIKKDNLEKEFYSLDISGDTIKENSKEINSGSNDYSYSYISKKSNKKNIIGYMIDDINTFLFKDICFNLKEMFYNCTSLYSLTNFLNFNDYYYNYKIFDMSYMLYN